MPTQAERSAATRAALLAAAEALAVDRGFAQTALEDVAMQAGVTRGALYHHFADKAALFEALVLRAQQEIAAEIERRVPYTITAADQLKRSCRLFVEMMAARPINVLLVKEAPAILGAERWRALEAEYVVSGLQSAIEAARAEAATPDPTPVHIAARVLFGALNEAGLAAAEARASRSARQAAALIDRVVDAVIEAPPAR